MACRRLGNGKVEGSNPVGGTDRHNGVRSIWGAILVPQNPEMNGEMVSYAPRRAM